MSELPTGTVTFLFTDVEGSTRLLQELGAEYADALANHRRTLRDAFARHGGVEVDTQGDAFFFAFDRASDALAAAAEGREALEPGRIRVRMGVHTGEPIRTGEGYVGMDVHRAARIAAAGHGGQILVSQATRELVGGDGLRDLGEHRLKDLAAPERIYQFGGGVFPQLRTRRQGNLAGPPEALLGRKKELAEVLRLIRTGGIRVLTVTGTGGVGKTRFALEVASEIEDDFHDGAWFVDLAPLATPDLVLPTIASTIGARGDLARHLRQRNVLLVVDNFEHVLDAAAGLAAALDGAEEIVVLATSRAPLRIAGEREYPLRPLAEAPAIELFRARAEAAAPGFQAEYAPLAEVCRRLDRLPLAIELAAARARLLSSDTLIERLEVRLPLLRGGRRDAPERHRTLTATIDWSHNLLSDDEKDLFARLAVFAGGCTIAAAEDVCGADLDILQALLENSLLRSADDRLSMLETIREYAVHELEGRGEADDARRSHADYFRALAEDVNERFRGPEQYELVDLLEAEHDNMRAALDWCVQRDAGSALQLAIDLEHFWMIRDHVREADRWFSAALAAPGIADGASRAHAMRQAGHIARALGDEVRARRLHEESLALAMAANSEVDIAHSLVVLGRAEEGLRRFEELGDERRIASALHRLGHDALRDGDWSRARAYFARTVELYRRCESPADLANAVHSLGDCALRAGEPAEAAQCYRESLEIFSRLGSTDGVAYSVGGIASVAATRGDYAVAARLWWALEASEDRLGYRLVSLERDYYEHVVAPALNEPSVDPPSETVAVREALSYVD